MAKLSYTELKTIVAEYVDTNKISVATFNATANNIVGLLDKIGLIVNLDTNYQTDKLNMFDGAYLELGKTIEEWAEDLILPSDYDDQGSGALSPSDPTYRPVYYSYSLGKKKFKITIRNNNIERAVNNMSELTSIIAMQTKKLQDSKAVWRYGAKRQMLADLITKCKNAENGSTYATSTAYAVGTYLKTTGHKGVVVKPITATSYATYNTWNANVGAGYIIELDLTQEIQAPMDTETGEAFIKQIKTDVETAKDLNEGHSLNGNSLGATEGLVLVMRQGLLPSLEVDTYAGAFNQKMLEMGVQQIIIKDFGDNTDAFAVLMDERGMRLHPTYEAVRENFNGDGDFLNIFDHQENTAFISRNTFVKVYKYPQV